MNKRKFILIVVAVIVVGALLHREFPQAGVVVTLAAVALYLLAGARRTVRYLRRFRAITARQRVQAIVALAMLVVMVSAWMTGSVYYFMLLVLLAADYLASQKPMENEQNTP